jgi:hypothetical protein
MSRSARRRKSQPRAGHAGVAGTDGGSRTTRSADEHPGVLDGHPNATPCVARHPNHACRSCGGGRASGRGARRRFQAPCEPRYKSVWWCPSAGAEDEAAAPFEGRARGRRAMYDARGKWWSSSAAADLRRGTGPVRWSTSELAIARATCENVGGGGRSGVARPQGCELRPDEAEWLGWSVGAVGAGRPCR